MRTRKRIGDKIVTTIESPAVIEYVDILACSAVGPDDGMYETPWDNCDGFEHHLTHCQDERMLDQYRRPEGNDVIQTGDNRGKRIVMDCPIDGLIWRTDGASRQVIAEMRACAKRRVIAQLRKWYENGWEWYLAQCEFETTDGETFADSLHGIDCEEYADECRLDCVASVIVELETAGYKVSGKPVSVDRKKQYLESRRHSLRFNLRSQCWRE